MTQEELRKKRRMWIKRYYKTEKGQRARYELRKSYYAKTQHLSPPIRRKWTEQEIEMLLTFTGSDEELAWKIGRSVAAIQAKRHRINAGE